MERTATVNVLQFGAVADYVYPSTGTDNSSAIQSAFDAAEATGVRTTVLIPPGSYKMNTRISTGPLVNVNGDGATLEYRGSDLGGPILTINDSNSIAGNAIHVMPTITGAAVPRSTYTSAELQSFCGVRISNVIDSEITLGRIVGVPVGLKLKPTGNWYISYCSFYGGSFDGVKDCILIDTTAPQGWVNECSFYGTNFTPGGNAQGLGSLCGIKVSNTGAPEPNNHRFNNPCFQIPATSAYDLSVGKAVVLNGFYQNPTTRWEYHCTAAGTGVVATVPADKENPTTDSNGVEMTPLGPWFRSPMFFDNTGSSFIVTGARWEGGDGPFLHTIGNAHSNEIQHYPASGVINNDPVIDGGESGFVIGRILKNMVKEYCQPDNAPLAIKDIHKRYVASSTHYSVGGMVLFNRVNNVIGPEIANTATLAGAPTLCKDSIITSGDLGVFVDLRSADGYSVQRFCDGLGSMSNRMAVQPRGANFAVTPMTDDQDRKLITSATSWSANAVATGSDAINDISVSIGDQETPYCLVYLHGAANQLITTLTFEPWTIGKSCSGCLVSPFQDVMNYDRMVTGVPTGGYFDAVGEAITNLDTTPGQPIKHYVTAVGMLAPAWAATTVVVIGEFRSNAGRVYYANSAGTTGATPPTHATGTVSDGTIDWTFESDEATLKASVDVY